MKNPARVLEGFLAVLRWRSRCNRAVMVSVFSAGAVAAAHAVLATVRIAGWIDYPGRSVGTLAMAAAVVGLATSVSLFVPVREMRAIRAADRKLGLQGALLTALETTDSQEPIHRLLVTRTAQAVETARPWRALPLRPHRIALLVPAMVMLAFSLEVAATSQRWDRNAAMPAPAVLEFSGDLQKAVAKAFYQEAAGDRFSPEELGALLEIDEALLRGEITLVQARAELAGWLEAGTPVRETAVRPGATESGSPRRGDGGGPASRAPGTLVAALRALANPGSAGRSAPGDGEGPEGPHAGTEGRDGSGIGGRGDGAGRGLALSGVNRDRTAREGTQPRGGSVWTLPGSDRITGIARAASKPSPDPNSSRQGSVEQAGSRVGFERKRLTAGELEMVAAYHRYLRQRMETESPPGGSAGDEEHRR
jgi:hypothetical protein